MEGDCLSCMKYLMFIFNFFFFVSSFDLEMKGTFADCLCTLTRSLDELPPPAVP